jgi:hypothetical protein
MASSLMWMPLSAPICRAFFTASAAPPGPIVSTVTSPLAGLDDLQGLLDGVLVKLGQQPVDRVAVCGLVVSK